MSLFQPEANMFERLETQDSAEVIARPSLSYWQDAWVRLKKNTRAIISLNIIILLAIFTLLGPFIWDVDPALQDLNQVAQPPSMPKTALVVESFRG